MKKWIASLLMAALILTGVCASAETDKPKAGLYPVKQTMK